jgi:negative regulator of flagellin synthesis FlgM
VDINPFSARLQSLESSLANQPAIDETKVAEVRQAITEGRFSINPDAIADKLMKSVKDLLTKQK